MAHFQLSRTRSVVASLTTSRRREIERITGSYQRQIETREQERAAQEAVGAARMAALEQRRTEIFTRAHRGLSGLIALNKEPVVVRMVSQTLTLRPGNFVFYEALRPSGEAWDKGPEYGQGDRIAKIEFAPNAIIFLAGSKAVPCDNVILELNHDASLPEQEALLDQIVASVRSGTNGRRALNWQQRVDEWDPEELLAHVLAECAERKNREHYLGIALENFRITGTDS